MAKRGMNLNFLISQFCQEPGSQEYMHKKNLRPVNSRKRSRIFTRCRLNAHPQTPSSRLTMEMTREYLRTMCKEARSKNLDQYTTPSLNDKLYLHYKGFRKVENLDEYTALKCLWLEGNGLAEISGLNHQPLMKVNTALIISPLNTRTLTIQ